MTSFYTADNHFFHKNIIKLCERPFADLEEMHESMIERWNKVITPADTVTIVGDFSLGSYARTREILGRLNGKKDLVAGNHDPQKSFDLFDTVWKEGFYAYRKHGNFEVNHYPYELHQCKNCGWSEDLAISKNNLPENAAMKYTKNQGAWLLHGHVHNAWKILRSQKMINVGVDVWDFTPVHEDVIRGIIVATG